jgi:hypothetical protein
VTPPGGERALTSGETALVGAVFGTALDPAPVRLRRTRFFPFHPRGTVMAPMGHIHFHPHGPHWQEDFTCAPLGAQALLVHEMVHVWQAQTRGRWWLPLMRHPFCAYEYRFMSGKRFTAYGIEQQAELVAHAFLARHGAPVIGAPSLADLLAVVPFPVGL